MCGESEPSEAARELSARGSSPPGISATAPTPGAKEQVREFFPGKDACADGFVYLHDGTAYSFYKGRLLDQ